MRAGEDGLGGIESALERNSDADWECTIDWIDLVRIIKVMALGSGLEERKASLIPIIICSLICVIVVSLLSSSTNILVSMHPLLQLG